MKLRSTAIASIVMTGAALAGPLTPPPGPIAPTGKSLAEVEARTPVNPANTPGDSEFSPCLYRITQPGSYYLTGNIAAAFGKNGLEISADDVTLDLNGFALVDDLGESGRVRQGIYVYSDRTNVTIRNGTIRGWSGNGLLSQAANCTFENLKISDCTYDGLFSQGMAVVRNVMATRCGETGITIAGGTVTECVATKNGDHGFYAASGAALLNCVATDNTQCGFVLGKACATNCTATGNDTYGFMADESSVINCTSMSNAVYAIRAAGSCTIRGNTCSQSHFPNIYLAEGYNRVEGNSTSGGTMGIQVSAQSWRNVIVGNMLIGQSGQAIMVDMTDNIVGPLHTGYGTIGTNSPWANISH